ncbi:MULTISPECIES: TetR family transcriptional regulator [Nocardia]|uniref:TetR family transcriptional regulator n=1 Tax=Nocardia TaxID=1817 RepID=UPI001893FEBE|nr:MULTISPECIES: TetR family transcriptional regulator [Nocardia]MBF6348356.1 TetR family transcriptional regulator [Nocardia flavorosea]
MPRIAEPREPGQPSTTGQQARRRAILRAAARLGAEAGLERVQMSEIATAAGVALGTLYRYYPSKHHLYWGVLANAVEDLPAPQGKPGDPVGAVADFLETAVVALLRSPRLGRAMLVSANAVRSAGTAANEIGMRDRILAVADITDPDVGDYQLARLVEQTAYGIMTWATAGQLDAAEAAADMRRACALLLAPWAGRE